MSQQTPTGTMRGVIRSAAKRVEVVELPRPRLEPGTAIVRVGAAGICGSDLHGYRAGGRPQERPEGHEVAGRVVEIAPRDGETGERIREGDLVAIDTICLGRACGDCRWCREGAFFHCRQKRQGPDWSGAFAEYVKRDVRGLFPLPAGMIVEEGALVEPLAVAVHALRLAELRPGESMAIIGAGTIGMASLLAAVAMDARDVYVLARHPHQADLARALGAAEAIVDEPRAAAEQVRDRTQGQGVDLVVETVGGDAPTLDQAWPMLRQRGRVAALGLFGKQVPVDLSAPLGKEATLLFPVCYGEREGVHDFQVAIDLIASRKAPAERLITHRFALEQAAEAFATADDKSTRSVKVQFSLPDER